MKKILIFTLITVLCMAVLCACSQPTDAKNEKDNNESTTSVKDSTDFVLSSNSEKATMTADKDYKTVIQITNTYPDEIVCVFDDPEIATCEWVQWLNNKGSLMFTGLNKGQTVLTIYAGVTNKDITTAEASITVNVFVEDQPSVQE